jgi:hypothetical protein
MRRGYAGVAAVCDAAQGVWDGIAPGLQEAATRLAEATKYSAGLGDQALANAVGAAQANLDGLRDTLNGDPLAFWAGGRADTARLTRLAGQVTGVAARAAELDRLRQQAGGRISALTAAVSAAATARQDAAAAWQRAAAKIADAVRPPMPDVNALAGRLAALAELWAAGRWGRLAAELDAAEQEAAAAASDCRAVERAARAQLDRRNELRGLLEAYRAKAARLGAAEDAGLEELYGRARDLLWTAPCGIRAAAAAVSGYQQAVLAVGGQGGPA